MNNPIGSFFEYLSQLLQHDKRVKIDAELARKKAELERIRNTRCPWDDYYAKKKAERKTNLHFGSNEKSAI